MNEEGQLELKTKQDQEQKHKNAESKLRSKIFHRIDFNFLVRYSLDSNVVAFAINKLTNGLKYFLQFLEVINRTNQIPFWPAAIFLSVLDHFVFPLYFDLSFWEVFLSAQVV